MLREPLALLALVEEDGAPKTTAKRQLYRATWASALPIAKSRICVFLSLISLIMVFPATVRDIEITAELVEISHL